MPTGYNNDGTKRGYQKGHPFYKVGEKGWFSKGQVPWNKKEKVKKECLFCGKNYFVIPSVQNIAKYCSRKCHSSSKVGKPSKNLGKKHPPMSLALRKKWREVALKRVADGKHNNYKGGITPISEKIRKSLEYRLWREAIFKRDNWTCVWCGLRGGRLNADHIKAFAYYPELRFAIDNGRTLCEPCHKTTDTFGRKSHK